MKYFFILLILWNVISRADPLPLQDKYVGEHMGKPIGDTFFQVEYWDEAEQRKHEYRPGCLGSLLEMDGKYIYVILEDGRMILGQFDFGRIHHSTLSGGKPVLAAGWIHLTKGKATFISNHSGHFKPTAEHLEFAKRWLIEKGALK